MQLLVLARLQNRIEADDQNVDLLRREMADALRHAR